MIEGHGEEMIELPEEENELDQSIDKLIKEEEKQDKIMRKQNETYKKFFEEHPETAKRLREWEAEQNRPEEKPSAPILIDDIIEEQGFTLVHYYGTGSTVSINHSLGKKPDFYKNLDSSGSWQVYHKGLGPVTPGINPEQMVLEPEKMIAKHSDVTGVGPGSPPTDKEEMIHLLSSAGVQPMTKKSDVFHWKKIDEEEELEPDPILEKIAPVLLAKQKKEPETSEGEKSLNDDGFFFA